jgi:FAD/FMN-containing dehydrogenase
MVNYAVMSRRRALGVLAGTAALTVTGLTDAACSAKKAPVATNPGPVLPADASPADWNRLASSLTGRLLRPSDSGYADAARLYNPRFDAAARPTAVAKCQSQADVAACVRFAGPSRVPVALRAGGHSYGGWSTTSGLVIDVTGMRTVVVDRATMTARIGGGAQLADVYAQLAGQGVAIAGGSCPTVGLTGLALGGGVGVLTRAYGLTCDAVRSLEVVTADGRQSEVDGVHNADLFWALRGGGAGLAAVTALTVAVRPAPTVQTFYLKWDGTRAADVLAAWQPWLAGADQRLWSTCKLLGTPSDGQVRVTVSGTWIGPSAALDGQLAPLLARTGTPASTVKHTLSYAAAMSFEAGCSGQDATTCLADSLTPAKRQAFAATSSIVDTALPGDGILTAVAQARAALEVGGIVEGGVSFDSLGGAVSTMAADATAFPYRHALATVQYTATWPSGDTPAAPFDAYVRGFRSALAPWLGQSAYVNYADATIANYGEAYWGGNYRRLQTVTRAVDPYQLFAFAQSPRP